MSKPLVSLCMPTNGVIEWCFPVLDSIYNQGIDNDLFEVVVTDNGKNTDFKKKIKEYSSHYGNLVYEETDALPFINEIESYRRASGALIKFVNHRTMLVNGALHKLINFAKDNIKDKPVTYFSNGAISELEEKIYTYSNFDLFVRNLSFLSSWSTGMTIWKIDFEKLPNDVSEFNVLFPHTNVLFNERNRERYKIDNTVIFDEMPQGKKPKGDYDLFGAFGIEYPGIICDLLRDGNISIETYRYVSHKNLEFIARLYFDYFIRKRYCSYDLNGINRVYGVFYTKGMLKKAVLMYVFNGCIKKLKKR